MNEQYKDEVAYVVPEWSKRKHLYVWLLSVRQDLLTAAVILGVLVSVVLVVLA